MANGQSPPVTGAMRTRRWSVVLLLLSLVAYAAALWGDFVFDDIHAVAANPALQAPVDWWRLCWDPDAFSAGSARMFRPVLLLSLAANHLVSGSALAFKAGNLLLHALITVLAFGWLLQLRLPRGPAALAMAVFAVHPLLSEAVNLISSRSELLLVLGSLVALRSHLRLLRGGASAMALAGMVAGTLIACGSKETGVVLPGLLLVQAMGHRVALPAPHAGRGSALGIAVVVALVVGYLLLRKLLLGEATVELLGRSGADPHSGHGRSLVCHWATMGVLLPRALLQMLWPFDLSLDPPVQYYPGFASLPVLAGWSGVLGLVVATWLAAGRRAGARRLGLAVAIGMALPWVVVPLNMPLAEHRLYGVLLGLLVVVATLLPRRWPALAPMPRLAGKLGVGALLLGLAGLATARSLDYRDERLLWQRELAARPHSWRAHWGLGTAEIRAGRVAAGLESVARAHHLYDGHFDLLRNYAEALIRLPLAERQPARAVVIAERLVAAAPKDPWAHAVLAEAQFQYGRHLGDPAWFVASEATALRCLELGPPKALVYRLAAAACGARGDLQAALRHLDTSLERGLDYVGVRLDRAAILRELGQPQAAHRELLLAQKQAPTDPAVLQALWAAARPGR